MVRTNIQPCQEAEIEEKNFYHNVFNNQNDEKDFEDLDTFFFCAEEASTIEQKERPFKNKFYEPCFPRLY